MMPECEPPVGKQGGVLEDSSDGVSRAPNGIYSRGPPSIPTRDSCSDQADRSDLDSLPESQNEILAKYFEADRLEMSTNDGMSNDVMPNDGMPNDGIAEYISL